MTEDEWKGKRVPLCESVDLVVPEPKKRLMLDVGRKHDAFAKEVVGLPIMALMEPMIDAALKAQRHKDFVEANKRTIACCKERRLGRPSCPDYDDKSCAVTKACDVALKMMEDTTVKAAKVAVMEIEK